MSQLITTLIRNAQLGKLILVCGLFWVLGCTNTGTQQASTINQPKTEVSALMAVSGGKIEGEIRADGLKVWQGVPYAAAPVGQLRWQSPQPVTTWTGVRQTKTPGAKCIQAPGPEGGFYSQELGTVSEDCLTLNVWSRATNSRDKLPVMYWIHGGGLTQGAGGNYLGDFLTAKGVVLVTINYRLGPFGFYAHEELSAESPSGASGNQGIADQIAGLRWVRENIEKFGGDPNNVTIFGESAGSLSVSLVQASPLARGLFHKAIGESGGSFQPMTHRTQPRAYSKSSEQIGEEFAQVMLADHPDLLTGSGNKISALRSLPVEQVLASSQQFNQYERFAIVDGVIIPNDVSRIFAAGQQSDVPVLIGSNAHEGTTFLTFFQPVFGSGKAGFEAYANAVLPEAGDRVFDIYPNATDAQANDSFGHLFADTLFTFAQREWAVGMGNVPSPAFLYYFTWAPPIPEREQYGAFHAAEIGYVFGELTLFGAVPTEADAAFAESISDLWVNFAKTGVPSADGVPDWPPFTEQNQSYLELGEEIKVGRDLRLKEVELIRQSFDRRRGGGVE